MSFHTSIRSAPRPGTANPGTADPGGENPGRENPGNADPGASDAASALRAGARPLAAGGPLEAGLAKEALNEAGNEAGKGGSKGLAREVGREVGSGLMLAAYLDSLGLVERMHRLLLDVIKDEFERLGILDINAVQALLLFNIGANEVTAGELKSRGYYQGSNVSYNLKKLVELGYMFHSRCEIDRRSVRVSLTAQGLEVRRVVNALFERHAEALTGRAVIGFPEIDGVNAALRRLERFWSEQIRYIY